MMVLKILEFLVNLAVPFFVRVANTDNAAKKNILVYIRCMFEQLSNTFAKRGLKRLKINHLLPNHSL
jgi:hypothetical protein